MTAAIKNTIVCLFNLVGVLGLSAQPKLMQRVMLIGDAGEINQEQTTVATDAAGKILPGQTTVFYLGDNIYPRGMGLRGTAEWERGGRILRAQFEPFRARQTPVYFLPGNHDWDKMGKNGLEKIKAQNDFITSQQDPGLKMIPANGCPDPVAIPIGAEAVVIAYDSEWWLFPHEKENKTGACDCETEAEVLDRLSTLFWEYRDRLILLASHHPFHSNGVHGGKYHWKDHIFPFTALNRHLYIPLPGVGSLYPLLRTTVFQNAEDLAHPAYQHLIQMVGAASEGFPNIIKVAGHEHGLQLIDAEGLQIVSGAGAKSTPAKTGAQTLFANARQGFVVLDIYEDRTADIQFYVYEAGKIQEAYCYKQAFTGGGSLSAQSGLDLEKDSVIVAANSKYDAVGSWHRKIFGEGYRKEWAAPTKLPVLHLSQLHGGLKPTQRGGGMQTISLRLEDSSGKEWVLRSVNKVADGVLPQGLRSSFARDLVDDYISGQHPYGALLIPPLASALEVEHATPVIGVVAPDTNLGMYNRLMAGTVALLEEREPGGDSDNSEKFIRSLIKDNDNSFKGETFFRAMALDLLVSDWDRHEDQWRWVNVSPDKKKDYVPVPRDRDQVLKINTGLVPRMITRSWLMPTFQGFDSTIPAVKYSLYKHRFVHPFPAFQFSKKEWTAMTDDVLMRLSDSVIDRAVTRLPLSAQQIRGGWLAEQLKRRRNHLAGAMDDYYDFYNEIVDLRLSDKNEQIRLEDGPQGGLHLIVREINKNGELKGKLVDRVFDPRITRELRIYTGNGKDTILIDFQTSKVALRLIGGADPKHIAVNRPGRKIPFYSHPDTVTYEGLGGRIRKKISRDSLQTAFVPVNLYPITMPLATVGYNRDDGVLFGVGFRHIQQKGFRKLPYSSSQQVILSGALATGAFRIKAKADWIHVLGKADVELYASTDAPHNTHNFFGSGNETVYDKAHSISYYRSRYTLVQVDPLLRWRWNSKEILRTGPAFQYYTMKLDDNKDRYILNHPLRTYDSITLDQLKVFAGAIVSYERDTRNHTVFPSGGGFFSISVRGYKGLNAYSKSLVQAQSAVSVYLPLNPSASIVLADRLGGGATFGQATFYQSLFLGGNDNLRGFRNYRFAGNHLLYNNLELRMRLAQIGSYILPGQLGATFFYDAGKVWVAGTGSGPIHQGVGGGIYFAPANIAVFQILAGYSKEGWNPHFTMGFRF